MKTQTVLPMLPSAQATCSAMFPHWHSEILASRNLPLGMEIPNDARPWQILSFLNALDEHSMQDKIV